MNRNQARRLAAFNAKKAAEKHFANHIGEILSGCPSRVDRATSLGSLRDKKEQEAPQKTNRIYYRDTNPLGNKIHAVQKMRGKSIPVYFD